MTCAICLEEDVPLWQSYVTPCQHLFHVKCITTWQTQSIYCPVCRQPFATHRLHPQHRAIYACFVLCHLFFAFVAAMTEWSSDYREILLRVLMGFMWAFCLGINYYQHRLIGDLVIALVLGLALGGAWVMVVLARLLIRA